MEYKQFSPMSWRKHNMWNVDITSLQLETLRCSQCPWPSMRISFNIVCVSQVMREALSERTAVMPPFNMTSAAL